MTHKEIMEELRKQVNPIEKSNCFICGRHAFISKTFRLISLKECAEILNNEKYDVSKITIEEISLCPNCHEYMRGLRGDWKVKDELIEALELNFTGTEMKKILKLQSKMYDCLKAVRKGERKN